MPTEPSNHPAKASAKPRRLKLNQTVVERLRPEVGKPAITYWDLALPGFGIRVSPLGRKTWVAMYRVVGTKPPIEVMESIGPITVITSLTDARERARRSMDLARQGIHPVKQRQQQLEAEQAAAAADAFKLEQLVERFIDERHQQNRPSTVYESRRLMRRALHYLGHLPVKQISKAHILAMVNDLRGKRLQQWRGNQGGALSEASGVLRQLRSCFKWAVAQDLIERDPTAGVLDPITGKRERSRTLSDPEILALWKVCESIGYPWGPLVQLLLLTGQRLREVSDLTWGELDLEQRVWSLPEERAKNNKAHTIHLSDASLAVIAKVSHFEGQPFVFSSRGGQSVQGYSDAKRRIDAMLAARLPEMPPWVMHDLRRTATTGMARLGVPHHVADKVLNHRSGKISGVAAVYNQFEYLDERKDALNRWGEYVARLVGANVVSLHG